MLSYHQSIRQSIRTAASNFAAINPAMTTGAASYYNDMPNQPENSFTCSQLWHVIEQIAVQRGVSLSKLASDAGLNPTCLSRSKRKLGNGQDHWLSTSSLAKILHSCNISLPEFASYFQASKPTADPRQIAAYNWNDINHLASITQLPPSNISIYLPAQIFASQLVASAQVFAIIGADDPDYHPWLNKYRFLLIDVFASILRGDLLLVRYYPDRLLIGAMQRRTALQISISNQRQVINITWQQVNWVAKIVAIYCITDNVKYHSKSALPSDD